MPVPADRHRDVCDIVVHIVVLVYKAVTAAHIAVIGGVDDYRVFDLPRLFEGVKYPPDGVVVLADYAAVECGGVFPAVFPGEVFESPAVKLLMLNIRLAFEGFAHASPRLDLIGVIH